jgi:hypothetical protein
MTIQNEIDLVGQLSRWTADLTRIASKPLQYCPDFPRIAARHEQWWKGELTDGPLLLATSDNNPSRPITRRLEDLENPDHWFDEKIKDLKQSYRAGDSLPNVRIDFGAVALGAMMGAKIEFGSDTTWTEAFIDDDWSNEPQWNLKSDNSWWVLLQKLLARVAADAAGKYLVCTPDIGGSADLLLNFRGSTGLCMDAIDAPHRIINAINAIYPIWREAFCAQYRLTVERGAGVIHWHCLWSNQPYVIPACDFGYMIGPDEYAATCLDDIARQAGEVGRAVFHLDGPGSARHIDALLELPQLQAIQFTPGEGTLSALAWVDMFRKIQDRGKSVLVFCPLDEVVELSKRVDPARLAMIFSAPTPKILDETINKLRRSKLAKN